MSKKIMVVAGEASGDSHAGKVICALKKFSPEIEVFGVGGEKMRKCGAEIIYDISKISFIGFIDVLKNLKRISWFRNFCAKTLLERKPDAVLLVDYPGFNLRFAKFAKQNGFKVFYYIAPQVWAWGRGRVKDLKNYVNKLFVIFEFEEEFFRKFGVDAEFVGHPLLEDLKNVESASEEDFFDRYGISRKEVISFFPGSRVQEVKSMLGTMLKAGKKLQENFDVEIVFSKAKTISDSEIEKIGGDEIRNFKFVDDSHLLLRFSKIAVVKSGTTSLEAGILGVPMVVCYKTSFLNYLIGRMLIKTDVVDSISLPNIVLRKKLVAELIQNDFNEWKIFEEVRNLLTDEEKYKNLRSELLKIKDLLSLKNSNKSTSEIVAEKIISNL
jgi:lipid-A-disaccharide synthase